MTNKKTSKVIVGLLERDDPEKFLVAMLTIATPRVRRPREGGRAVMVMAKHPAPSAARPPLPWFRISCVTFVTAIWSEVCHRFARRFIARQAASLWVC